MNLDLKWSLWSRDQIRGEVMTNLLEETVKVLNAVHAFAKANGVKVQPGSIYLPSEWKSRGERYCTDALLVITYDGGDMRRVCSLDGEDYPLNEAFQKMLGELGYFFEEGTHWYGGIYVR